MTRAHRQASKPSTPGLSVFSLSFSLSPIRDSLCSAAPHFLDDGTVIEISLAGAHAGLEHVRMHAKHRKLLPDRGCLIEHQMHVFQCLLQATFRGKITAHHFRPFSLHHLRIGRRATRDLEKRSWSRPSRSAKTRPSASARRLRPRIRLTASLARPPSPTLPTWRRRTNNASNTSLTSSAIEASPPINATPSPRRT